jgi:hypothetical protein
MRKNKVPIVLAGQATLGIAPPSGKELAVSD